MSTAPISPGFYGKLPSRGDFLVRHLARDFLDPWDNWLQMAIFHSRQQLQEAWVNLYCSSPLWRFALSPGVCGENAFAGVLMPSVDRVGRYFPLVIATPLSATQNPIDLLTSAWFEQAEQVLLNALDDKLDLEVFASRIQELGMPAPDTSQLFSDRDSELACYCPLTDLAELSHVNPIVSGYLLQRSALYYGLWWCSGSERIAPCLLICQGLPPSERFAALLSGDWAQWGWDKKYLLGQNLPTKVVKHE